VGSCGYDVPILKAEGRAGVAVIRDVLGTESVDMAAQRLGAEAHQTDAGYVFLKARRKELMQEGYVVPIYGESSGHGWLQVTGPIENPLVITAIFGVMVAEYKKSHSDETAYACEGLVKTNVSAPYRRSGRFDPGFHASLLRVLSGKAAILPEAQRTKLGIVDWTHDTEGKMPQAIIAMGKDYVIRRICEDFATGTVIQTTVGELKVDRLDAYEEEGIYRFADIRFSLNGAYIGRFIFRASANDPNFVCSFEVPYASDEQGNNRTPEATQRNYNLVGAVMLDWLERKEFSPISDTTREFKKDVR
jgi:phosphomannomutase